ncbi:peptidase [Clostridium butyricum]|uniref:peptidase n=1 Tax=Clostridium butyricum TaxID=1492 RepID=UPI001CA91A84|nr:peptidase [Clostridium butyricum]MBZ0313474.1 peptidase [Clostridium butyricum]
MDKLILKNNALKNLSDSKIDLGELEFDIKQFKIPSAMVALKEGIKVRIEKSKNLNGELVETGKYSVEFGIYDLNFIKLVVQNGSTEIGNPISIIIEGQDNIPNVDTYEEGEFIPISFNGIKIRPKKILKKVFAGGKNVDAWVYDALKIEADSYSIGAVKTNEK